MTATKKHASANWFRLITDRVGQRRSRLDFQDIKEPQNADDHLLAAVLSQLLHTPFEVISKGLNTKKLDEWTPGLRSRASRRFGDSQGIASFALTEAIRPDRSDLSDVMLDAAAQAIADPNVGDDEVILELCTAYFNAVCDDPCLRLQMFAWLAAHQSVELRKAFIELYGTLGERVSVGVKGYLDSIGRQPVEGTSYDDLAAAMGGIVEGLAIRTAVDPDAVPPELPAKIVLAMLNGMTEPVGGDTIDLTDGTGSA